jgi:hypothetical protein
LKTVSDQNDVIAEIILSFARFCSQVVRVHAQSSVIIHETLFIAHNTQMGENNILWRRRTRFRVKTELGFFFGNEHSISDQYLSFVSNIARNAQIADKQKSTEKKSALFGRKQLEFSTEQCVPRARH